ncbi:unnamed protein product [Allacma fusca]|uniref:Uncharacterized protein n=1 Tax=Allacma fusca TaxID=39272 RepID=A0A8J2KTH1_9HEXA|nr:unnamed protein product [Allacma fusca]
MDLKSKIKANEVIHTLMAGKKLSSKSEMSTKQTGLESDNLSEFFLRAKDSKEILKQKIRKNVHVLVSDSGSEKGEDIGATGEESCRIQDESTDLDEKGTEFICENHDQEACGESGFLTGKTSSPTSSLKGDESTESVRDMRKKNVRFDPSVTSVDFDLSSPDTIFNSEPEDDIR